MEHIEKNKRKKILLLSDDIRLPSGVGTVSKELVLGTAHRYNWFQIAAAINHPDKGKVIDLSDDINKQTGLTDSYVKILPNDGYGDPDIVRFIINSEKPDAVFIYTDPRFFIWFFNMSHEIRQQIPIFYYNIWDDLPYPMYNKPYYESCDLLMAISKQTYNINKNVLGENNYIEINKER